METLPQKIEFPNITIQTGDAILKVVKALGIPREVLATDEEISYAWEDLPRELKKIPPDNRDDLIAKMCIAISCGLFDSAINYIWNSTIIHLRQKLKFFGLPFIAQILEKDFSESTLNEMQDSQLLDLTLKLNIISHDAFFFLDQCRNTRNNFSAAHPSIGKINDREFITFLNRCVRYALVAKGDIHGIDVNECVKAVKAERFTEEQKNEWLSRLKKTCDAQCQLIFQFFHGIYCDPASQESARYNVLLLCKESVPIFSEVVKSNLINKHSEYVAKGDIPRHTASRRFFEQIGLLGLLSDAERHSIISNALQRLWTVHLEINNFYNEKPFADQLRELIAQTEVPASTKNQLVHVVVACYLGNGYGVATSAISAYESIIKNFSPREIEIMFSHFCNTSPYPRICGQLAEQQFAKAARLIAEESVPASVKNDYIFWKNK